MKTALSPLDVPDFERASKGLRKSAKSGRIDNSDLGYTTAMLLSVCVRGLRLSPQEAEILDQSVGIAMTKPTE